MDTSICTLPSNWTPYSKDTKPVKDGFYFVTAPSGSVELYRFEDGMFPSYADKRIIAWMPEPEPYNPNDKHSTWMPVSLALPVRKRKVLVTIRNDIYSYYCGSNFRSDVTAWMYFPKPYKPLAPKSDPLMGWMPLEQSLIPKHKLVRVLYRFNDILVPLIGYREGSMDCHYVYFNLRHPTEVSALDIMAWKYFDNDELPPLEAFREGK